MPGGEPVRVPPGTHEAVVTPNVVRFAIQKVDRLHVARMEERQVVPAQNADVLDFEDEPIRRYFRDVHFIDGSTREIVGLLKVEEPAVPDLSGREVRAAVIRLRVSQGMGFLDECAPLLVGGRPVTHAGEF